MAQVEMAKQAADLDLRYRLEALWPQAENMAKGVCPDSSCRHFGRLVMQIALTMLAKEAQMN